MRCAAKSRLIPRPEATRLSPRRPIPAARCGIWSSRFSA
ncbi:hypothetical protein EVA_14972 [gut metagenome]|uniref:Uncharacterized protein n=1 Tax=gut metagenome TaxID=749906 RepID=J9G528_9ZZZZ